MKLERVLHKVLADLNSDVVKTNHTNLNKLAITVETLIDLHEEGKTVDTYIAKLRTEFDAFQASNTALVKALRDVGTVLSNIS